MSYFIQESDKSLLLQRVLDLRIRIDVYDDKDIYVDSIVCGLVSGGCNVDAASDIRRTATYTLIPNQKINTLIEENSLIWLNRRIFLYIGIKNLRTQEYVWYKQGKYVIQTYDSNYDATTNELAINCVDQMAELDGTKNGQLGALITSFPAYKEYLGGAETNYLVENATLNVSTYQCNIEGMNTYKAGTYLVVKIPQDNPTAPYLKVNDLSSLPILTTVSGQALAAGKLKAGYYYSFLISSNNTVVLANPIPMETVADGTPLNYYIIRDAVITALSRLGNIKDYNIDDIGEYQAMPLYNSDYLQYRKENPLWNNIPYDLEFSVGDNVLSILTTLRDLYPNYEMFFDENGTFVAQMIPSAKDDDIYINDEYLQNILISENYSIDTSLVKNVTEVWGESLDTDFTSKSCELSDNVYTIDVDEYGEKYQPGDKIAITFPETNPSNPQVKLHTLYTYLAEGGNKTEKKEATLDAVPLLDQMTDKPLAAGTIQAGGTYVCKLKMKIENDKPVLYFYFLSQYQPHAINILTDGSFSDEEYTCADGSVVKKYTKEYFKDFYNCRIVSFTVDRNSPFTIQKLGVILNVFSGGEFDNIESDERALARAEYENWKSARLTDSISITTKICPWLDVNKKVSFRRSDKKYPEEYLIQSISHDTSGGTSTITMSKFRPLYQENAENMYSHNGIGESTHDVLHRYTHNNLRGE